MKNRLLVNSFGKEHRLLSKKDFEHLRKESLKVSASQLLGYFKKNSTNITRIGISVSKKSAKANLRNRIKRIIRETFRTSSFKNGGVDMLIVVKKSKSRIKTNLLGENVLTILKEVVK